MGTVNGCNLPEDLYYLVDKHVWVRFDALDRVTVGMTDVAAHLAGNVIVVSPKRVGRTLEKGQSAATVESGKWVGPVPAPINGEIVEVNENLKAHPELLNEDPYGNGWILRIRPASWDEDKGTLVTGPEGLERYRAKLEAENIRCG